MTNTIQQWLEQGQSWQDSLLATGLANTSRDTRKAIERWASLSGELGFEAESTLCTEMLNPANSNQHRTTLLAELLIRMDMTSLLYQIGELRNSVIEKNN